MQRSEAKAIFDQVKAVGMLIAHSVKFELL
jgi:hypothetical protein